MWNRRALSRADTCTKLQQFSVINLIQRFIRTKCSTAKQNKNKKKSLFGHVVRLDDHTPAHRALSQVAAARTGPHFGRGWRRRSGRPRHSWIQQISDGTPFSILAEWSKAHRHGHSGLTQRTSAVCAIW